MYKNHTNHSYQESIEGIFFVHSRASIEKDWCPLCNRWTKFRNPVKIKMDNIEKRNLNCGHQIIYIFLIEEICGEIVKTVRKRVLPR